jgi:hypothetical protein
VPENCYQANQMWLHLIQTCKLANLVPILCDCCRLPNRISIHSDLCAACKDTVVAIAWECRWPSVGMILITIFDYASYVIIRCLACGAVVNMTTSVSWSPVMVAMQGCGGVGDFQQHL